MTHEPIWQIHEEIIVTVSWLDLIIRKWQGWWHVAMYMTIVIKTCYKLCQILCAIVIVMFYILLVFYGIMYIMPLNFLI